MLTVNIIGAGKLGKTLMKLGVKLRIFDVLGICNTTLTSSKNAAKFIGQGKAYKIIDDLPAADLTFITTPDRLVAETAKKLSRNKNFKLNSMVVHCSGAHNSKILRPVKNKCYIGSIHPIRSFSDPKISVKEFAGTFCAIEGDKKIIGNLEKLFKKMGARTFQIDSQKKPLYHAATVFAANYLVTLVYSALSCLTECNLKKNQALEAILNLMQGTLTNIALKKTPSQALTGPIKRGDIPTITKHLTAIRNPQLKQLYQIMGEITLDFAELDEGVCKKIRKILKDS